MKNQKSKCNYGSFRIAQKRENAVTAEITRMFGDDKKMSKKEKDERILWKKNEVMSYYLLSYKRTKVYSDPSTLFFVRRGYFEQNYFFVRSLSTSSDPSTLKYKKTNVWLKNTDFYQNGSYFVCCHLNSEHNLAINSNFQVADYEATTFAIFYNNAMFFVMMLGLSFFILVSQSSNVNYFVSMLASAGVVALLSTGSQK